MTILSYLSDKMILLVGQVCLTLMGILLDEVTDQGRLQKTFDPSGGNVYIVAGGSSNHFHTVASYLMTLKTLLMLRETRRDTIFVYLAMPGYAKYHRSQTGKSPEEYIALTDENGIPIDEFIALSVYDWQVFPLFRVLRDGYLPDRDSGGQVVSTVFKLNHFDAAIEETYRRIIRDADVLGLEREQDQIIISLPKLLHSCSE